jgi:hypothetical protein
MGRAHGQLPGSAGPAAGVGRRRRRAGRRHRGRGARAGQPRSGRQPRAQGQEDGLGDERPGRPGDEEGGTQGGTDHLVHDEGAGHQPGVADAEVRTSDDRRQQRAGGGVGEDLGDTEDEECGQDDGDADVPGEQGGREDDQDATTGQVHADEQLPAVDAVGEDARLQAEDQPRQPMQQGAEGAEERVLGLAGDQQWAGRESDAVAEVAHSGRPHQPTERRAHPGGQHRLDQSPHEHGL